VPEILPAECRLDRAKLISIEQKLDQVLEKQEYFISIDGPLGKIKDEIAVISASASAAHKRIDDHDVHINKLSERQWVLWAKSAVVGGSGAGVLYLIIELAKHLVLK
jgi:hypothetical protein